MTTTEATRVRRNLRLGRKKWPELNGEQQTGVLDWVVDLCLMHGASRSTAYKVAGVFAHGMETGRS